MSIPAEADLLIWGWLTLGVVSVLLSSLYSGLETGVYCLNPVKLRLRSEQRLGLSRWLADMTARRERLLLVLLIGNNVSNYGATAAAAILLAQTAIGDHRAELLTTLLVTPVLFVIGEMIPKNLFQRFADRLVYRWLWLLRTSQLLFQATGLVAVIGTLVDLIIRAGRGTKPADVLGAREQLHSMLRDTAAAGVLSRYQSQIAENVLNVSAVTVGDVMTPLRRVEMLAEDATLRQFHAMAERTPFSRWPVYRGGNRHDVIGVINVQEVLLDEQEPWDLARHLFEPVSMTTRTKVMPALLQLQRARRAMGIVVDGHGRAVGVVTMKDLVEEIVGELAAW